MELFVYLFAGLFMAVFLLCCFRLLAFIGEWISYIETLTLKVDRVAASIIQLSDKLSQGYKDFSINLVEKSKKEIVTQVLRALSKKDGKLKKRVIKKVTSKMFKHKGDK